MCIRDSTITAYGNTTADTKTPFTGSYDNCIGSLSNFRFVKGSAVYSGATYTVPTSNLTAISGTQLLTCQSGHLMTDASTNNHVIRLGSNSSYVNHKPAPTYESPFSGSIYFDGTDDYITAAGHADFAFGTGDFTIEMFVRQTDKSAGEGFYQIGHSSAPFDADTTNVAAGWYNYSGTIAYRVYGNNTGINSTNAMSPSDNDRCHHHIYMRKSGTSYVIVPMLRVFNDTARYVDQGGGKRKGSFAIYIEPWHSDIYDFLDLKKNHGKEEMSARDLFYAMWIPDLFMKRVEADKDWTLFSPEEVPDLHDLFGKKFEHAYCEYEKGTQNGQIKKFKKIPAKELWKKMLTRLFETGHPWITFKDACNVRSPQDHVGLVHSSKICTENPITPTQLETEDRN